MKLEEKTCEQLIEQIRRLQDRLDARQSADSARVEAIAKRCADYRKAARLANARADAADRKLKIMGRAIADAFPTLEAAA